MKTGTLLLISYELSETHDTQKTFTSDDEVNPLNPKGRYTGLKYKRLDVSRVIELL